MAFSKVTLSSRDTLTLLEKKKYIDAMYREDQKSILNQKRNQGFLSKFNNSIGFKPVVNTITTDNMVLSGKVESPEGYQSPHAILLQNLHTPLESNDIICFYLEDKKVIHSNPEFSYETKMIAEKWAVFLQKVFPQLLVNTESVEELPHLSLKDFALQYFYQNINKEINYTIEFSSNQLLINEELKEVLFYIQDLSDDKITIAQNHCSTCSECSDGEKSNHIEIVYLTYYGKDNEQMRYEEYGEGIFKVS